MKVTGVAGTSGHRRHPNARTTRQRPFLAARPHETCGQVMGIPPPPCLRRVSALPLASGTSSLAFCLLSYGYWAGLVPLLGSVLIFWTVYRLQQHSVRRVRDLEQCSA